MILGVWRDMFIAMGGNGPSAQNYVMRLIRRIKGVIQMGILARIMMKVQARQIRVDQDVATIDMQKVQDVDVCFFILDIHGRRYVPGWARRALRP